MSPQTLTPLEIQCLQTFRQRLHAQLGAVIADLRVFGSRARGEGDESSDVDVLVMTTTMSRLIKETIWDIANDLFLETDVLLSPLVLSQVEFHTLLSRERRLALDIQREGIPI